MTLPAPVPEVDLTQPYVWSTTRGGWANSGCAGCDFHVPDASPETTALIARIERELAVHAHEETCEVFAELPEACWQAHPGGVVPEPKPILPPGVLRRWQDERGDTYEVRAHG